MNEVTILLSPELEQFVKEQVESGGYSSASEVVREGIRLLQERDVLSQLRLQEVRKKIAIGIEQADRGEVAPLDLDTIKAKARLHLAQKGQDTDGPYRPNHPS